VPWAATRRLEWPRGSMTRDECRVCRVGSGSVRQDRWLGRRGGGSAARSRGSGPFGRAVHTVLSECLVRGPATYRYGPGRESSGWGQHSRCQHLHEPAAEIERQGLPDRSTSLFRPRWSLRQGRERLPRQLRAICILQSGGTRDSASARLATRRRPLQRLANRPHPGIHEDTLSAHSRVRVGRDVAHDSQLGLFRSVLALGHGPHGIGVAAI
jgi:hypothetical protein